MNEQILCPCKSQTLFEFCCSPFLNAKQLPQTPEQLMRSRYTAYALQNFTYIQSTMTGSALSAFNLKQAQNWAATHRWVGLRILDTRVMDKEGYVTFIATYCSDKGKLGEIEEKSRFIKSGGRWVYVDGDVKPS